MKSDAQLRKDIEDELACEPSVDAAVIGVAVADGIVTLSGHVASHAEKVAAERAATRILGVHVAFNHGKVQREPADLLSAIRRHQNVKNAA